MYTDFWRREKRPAIFWTEPECWKVPHGITHMARRMKIRNLLPIRKKTFVVNKFVPLMMTISSVAIYFKSNRVYKWEQMNRIFNNLIAMIIWDNTQLQTIRVQFTVELFAELGSPVNHHYILTSSTSHKIGSILFMKVHIPTSGHQKWLLKQIKLKPKYWCFNRYRQLSCP